MIELRIGSLLNKKHFRKNSWNQNIEHEIFFYSKSTSVIHHFCVHTTKVWKMKNLNSLHKEMFRQINSQNFFSWNLKCYFHEIFAKIVLD